VSLCLCILVCVRKCVKLREKEWDRDVDIEVQAVFPGASVVWEKEKGFELMFTCVK